MSLFVCATKSDTDENGQYHTDPDWDCHPNRPDTNAQT